MLHFLRFRVYGLFCSIFFSSSLLCPPANYPLYPTANASMSCTATPPPFGPSASFRTAPSQLLVRATPLCVSGTSSLVFVSGSLKDTPLVFDA